MVRLVDYKFKIFSQINPGSEETHESEDTDNTSDSMSDYSLYDADDREKDEGKNINKYMDQCALSAEWSLFYQLLHWCSQIVETWYFTLRPI